MDAKEIGKDIQLGVDTLAPILELIFPGFAAIIGGIKTAVDGLVTALGMTEDEAVKALVTLKTAQLNPATILGQDGQPVPQTGSPA